MTVSPQLYLSAFENQKETSALEVVHLCMGVNGALEMEMNGERDKESYGRRDGAEATCKYHKFIRIHKKILIFRTHAQREVCSGQIK